MTTRTWRPLRKDLADLSGNPTPAIDEARKMMKELEEKIAMAWYREHYPEEDSRTIDEAAVTHYKVKTFSQVFTIAIS